MGQPKWEADKMLDVYIHDYLIKRNLHTSAKTFMTEGKVCAEPVAIDAPGGFLFEWWSVFWDIFISRTNEKHSEKAASYIELQQMKARELQIQQEQQQRQLQQQFLAQLRRNMTHPSLNGAANPINPENLIGQPTANVMATKIYEERLKQPHQREGFDDPALKRVGDNPANFLEANNAALHKIASTAGQPSGSLFQNTAGNVSGPGQQGQVWSQSMPGNSQGSLVIDSSVCGGSGVRHVKCEPSNHGSNSVVPLKGWPLNSMDQLHPNLLQQRQKSLLQTAQQFQHLPVHQQRQILLQAQASSLPSILGETDPRKPKLLRANGLTGIDCLPIENDGSHSVGGQMHVSSMARVSSQDQNDLLYKIKMAQLIQQQQSPMSSQQNLQQQQLQQQQQETHQQSGRKRKHPSSSGAANSTGTGNTPGPSGNSLPSTPSTHTPGDMMSMAGTLQQSISASKNLMMHGSDGTGGLASPSNQLVDIEHFDDCALDENIESYLAHDNGEKMEGLSDTMKSGSEGHRMDSSKGLSFREVGCLPGNSKLLCCHFSSDGKLLASAGHDKKAVLWNVDSSRCKGVITEHTDIITDVRFSPNSMRLATSSFDRTVRVWDVDNHNYSLRSFTGHSTPIKSVDFHPNNSDVLCSCDEGSEIRYWSISQGACKRVFKGGTTRLRFQPQVGKYLATAAENAVAVFDVETSNCIYSSQKHDKPVQSLCWNATGNLVASVSEDCVKISSIADGGKCIQEMKCTGNVFQTCVFNPNYQAILVIGCNETLELWNMQRHTNMTIAAHESLITSLTESAATGMIASASHDSCVKLWR